MKMPLPTLIQPDTWNNIPICIVKAFKAMIEHSLLQDQHAKSQAELFRDHQREMKREFSKLERRISENNYHMHSNLDTRDEKLHERLHKQILEIERLGKFIDTKVKEINHKVDTEVRQ
jgi:hypothetical protein